VAHQSSEAFGELLDLIRYQIKDGEVSEDEALALRAWLRDHPDLAVVGAGREIAELLVAVLEDRRLSAHERDDLLHTLEGLAGQDEDS
jgi:cytochrome P450